MKRFNFKLETVLSLRENIEKQWEAKLGKVNSECGIIQSRIDQLQDKVYSSKMSGIDVGNYHVQTLYQERLYYQINIEKENLRKKEIELEKIKKVYLEKSIDRKIIDKLKDKAVSSYNKESLRDEIKFIDEINNASKIRENMLGGGV